MWELIEGRLNLSVAGRHSQYMHLHVYYAMYYDVADTHRYLFVGFPTIVTQALSQLRIHRPPPHVYNCIYTIKYTIEVYQFFLYPLYHVYQFI